MLPSELPELPAGAIVALDTETSGLYPDDGARVSVVSLAWWEGKGKKGQIRSVAWPFDQGTEGKPEQKNQPGLWAEADNLDLDEWEALLEWLRDKQIVMHNAMFDVLMMKVGCRRWPGVGIDLLDQVIWDTQNVCHLLWPLERTSLKPTCVRLFGDGEDDEQQIVKTYLRKAKLPAGRWDLMPWEIIGRYAAKDAHQTFRLFLYQLQEIIEGRAGTWLPDVEVAVERRLETMKTLTRIEWRGLPYDEVGSRDAAAECARRAKPLADALPFAPTDNAAKDYFFSEKTTAKGVKGCGMVPYQVTDRGAPSLTGEVLTRMVEDRVPYAEKWAQYRKVTNAASMWYDGYAAAVGSDGRLRTRFRQNGTVSTRFSVERVNLQAIPHDYRLGGELGVLAGIVTPRGLIAQAVPKGWKIYELDLAQAELRVAAMFAKCDTMLEMIAKDADLHGYTTQELGLAQGPQDDRWFEMRQVGKRANFSLCFRAQWKTFAAMVAKEAGIRLEQWEAERIVRDWNRLYWQFGQANERHESVVARRQNTKGVGWIDLINKERRWYGRYDDASGAFNQRVQGNLAQFGIDWMLQTDEFLRGQGYDATQIGGAGLVLVIHDSQVLLLPDNKNGKWLAEQCAGFGRDLWKSRFPDVPGGVDYHKWD